MPEDKYEEKRAKYLFGDIVVVDGGDIGVVVKTWSTIKGGAEQIYYEVYVRVLNEIQNFPEHEVERYRVRHKYLSEEEKEYQNYS